MDNQKVDLIAQYVSKVLSAVRRIPVTNGEKGDTVKVMSIRDNVLRPNKLIIGQTYIIGKREVEEVPQPQDV